MGLEGDAGIYIAILILLAIAALFTITGGLTAVIWTDFVQTIIMLIGSFILMGMGNIDFCHITFYRISTKCQLRPSHYKLCFFSLLIAFVKVGGYNELIRQFFMAYPSENQTAYDLNNRSCANIPADAMHLFKSINSPELPWTGVVFGVTISSIWYWCSDQVSTLMPSCPFSIKKISLCLFLLIGHRSTNFGCKKHGACKRRLYHGQFSEDSSTIYHHFPRNGIASALH